MEQYDDSWYIRYIYIASGAITMLNHMVPYSDST